MPRLDYTNANVIPMGYHLVHRFCRVNNLEAPEVRRVPRECWLFGACAYYRPEDGIVIQLESCAQLATETWVRNWNWPGSVTDREPMGVMAHELGHHCDFLTGYKKHSYSSDYSASVREASREKPISSYCPNDAEWFAEMFRLFVTNHALLKLLRPKTHSLLCKNFEPVTHDDWSYPLGPNVPQRILENLARKVAKR